MISMKEEEGSWHKEEANVVLRVYIISVNMRHNSSHYSTQLTTNVTLHKTKQSLHSSTQSFEAKPYLKIFSLLQELERRGPLSGLGFFTIERSTITGMLSTAVTYIIILVQFRMSTNWYCLFITGFVDNCYHQKRFFKAFPLTTSIILEQAAWSLSSSSKLSPGKLPMIQNDQKLRKNLTRERKC